MLDPRPAHRPQSRRTRWLPVAAVVVMVAGGGSSVALAVTVDRLSWEHDDAARTVVTISSSSPLDPAAIRSYPLADPPRAVVVLPDVRSGLDRPALEIGDRFVQRVRLVPSGTTAAPELLVVLDLADADAGILELRPDGLRLAIVVGGAPGSASSGTAASTGTATAAGAGAASGAAAGAGTASAAGAAAASSAASGAGSAAGEVTPAAPATPMATPTATATSTPTSTPTATPTATATATPKATEPAPPTATPLATRTPTVATGDPRPGADRENPGEPLATPASDDRPAWAIVELSASPRGEGETVLLLTADGRLPQGCARTLEMAGDPPRIVVSIRGLTAPDLPRTIELDDPVVARVRVVHDGEAEAGELHLVVQLARPGVAVAAVNQVGRRLAILLAPRAADDDSP